MMLLLRAVMGMSLVCAALIWGAGALGGVLASHQLVLGANYWWGATGLHVVDIERLLSVPLIMGLRGEAVLSPNRVVAFADQTGSVFTVDLHDGSQQFIWRGSDANVVREIAWSPDGTAMVFVASEHYLSGAEYKIYLTTGTTTRSLMPDAGYWSISGVTWSPDGEQIAFTAFEGHMLPPEIVAMDIASGAIRRLSPENLEAVGAAWSPDGTQIAFQGEPSSRADIYFINSDGSNLRNMTPSSGRDALPLWSPDGTRLAYVSCAGTICGLYVMNADGTNVRLLREYDYAVVFASSWSPDGTQIALELQGTYVPLQQIDVVYVDGSGVRTVSSREYSGYSPMWMP